MVHRFGGNAACQAEPAQKQAGAGLTWNQPKAKFVLKQPQGFLASIPGWAGASSSIGRRHSLLQAGAQQAVGKPALISG